MLSVDLTFLSKIALYSGAHLLIKAVFCVFKWGREYFLFHIVCQTRKLIEALLLSTRGMENAQI